MSPVHQVWPKTSCKAQWRGEKTRQTEEEVGRQHLGMDRPGVHQVQENKEKWRKLVAISFAVPQWPSQLRDRWDERKKDTKTITQDKIMSNKNFTSFVCPFLVPVFYRREAKGHAWEITHSLHSAANLHTKQDLQANIIPVLSKQKQYSTHLSVLV